MNKKNTDHSHQTASSLNTNSHGPSLGNYEYSTLHMCSENEKKVKPPAVPPKTYREDYVVTDITTPCPSNEELPGEGDDSCSVGSDSLYDMKLETVAEIILPERSTITGSDPTAKSVEYKPSHMPHAKNSTNKDSKKSLAAGVTDNEQNHSYQKLDEKAFSSPAAYNQVHVVRKQRTTTFGSNGDAAKQSTTGSHYESLQLNTLNKRSHYQQIVLKETFQ